MKTLQDVVLEDLLPDSISSDRQVKESAKAIDPELKAVSGFVFVGSVLANVDKLTSVQLDHIAYSFDLTTWRDYWPLSQKRRVAKTVLAQKCRMGTLSAVKKVLESLGPAVSITEWWQKSPKATPHTFEVVASIGGLSGGLSAEAQEDFFRLLNEAKPVRSHYTFTIAMSLLSDIQITGALRPASYARCSSELTPLSNQISVNPLIRAVSYSRL